MRGIAILLIEDDEDDILLATEAFEESRIVNTITAIRDGKNAINHFESFGRKEEIPHLVLLDINLPKLSGHEVLLYIKTHERYKSIPVIMLPTSSSEKDISQSCQNHVNCYIAKPIDVEDLMRAITKIEDFGSI